MLAGIALPLQFVQAQIVPPPPQSNDAAAQEFIRQQQRERALRQQQERTPDVHEQPAVAPAVADKIPDNESPCFVFSSVVLSGEKSDRFKFALPAAATKNDPALKRCIGVNGINTIMTRIQNAIVAKGFITTRVLAAPQDLSKGVLTLTVVQGHARQIRFANDADPRGTKWNAVPVSDGDVLNLRDIEQGLENFKRVPTAEADIQVEPTTAADAQPGDSDLVIHYKQAFPLRLNLSLDDSGTKATGKYIAGVTVSYDNALTLNDLLYVSVNHDLRNGTTNDHGTQGYTAHYSLPFGYWGLGFTINESSYHQAVAGVNQSYIYSGESESDELKLTRIVYRDARRKTTLSLRGIVRSSSNYIDDTEVEVQRRRTAAWELGIAHREFFGDTTLDADIAYRKGVGAFDAMAAPEEAFDEGTSRFKIVTADINLSVPFGFKAPWGEQRMRYQFSGRGQWNDTPLTPQDRFSIGGGDNRGGPLFATPAGQSIMFANGGAAIIGGGTNAAVQYAANVGNVINPVDVLLAASTGYFGGISQAALITKYGESWIGLGSSLAASTVINGAGTMVGNNIDGTGNGNLYGSVAGSGIGFVAGMLFGRISPVFGNVSSSIAQEAMAIYFLRLNSAANLKAGK